MHDIARFIAGFKRFQQNYFCDGQQLFEGLKSGQKPRVLVIACSDSRVDPAILTDCAPGDLFVVRNIANLVPPYEPDATHHGVSAALEYAVKHLQVQHVIVMGHGGCGGIHALLDPAQAEENSEFIGRWVDIAARARDQVDAAMPDADQATRQKACEEASVLVSLENLLSFPWLKEAVDAGQLSLHGWYFDLQRGELRSYLPETRSFEPLVTRCRIARAEDETGR